MGQIDTLHADISIRGHADAMSKIGSIRNAFQAAKPMALAYAVSTAKNVGVMAAASGAAAIAGSTVKLAADLERSRLLLKRYVQEDFGSLQAGIDQMASRTPIAISGLYEIASGAAQVGVKGTAGILAFTDAVAKLASVSDMSFNDTSKELAKLNNQFQLKPGDVKSMASTIAGMSAASAADPGELITLMKYVAGPASTLGMKFEDVAALSAAAKDAGASSEVAGTAMSRMMGDMVEKGEEWARLLGVSVSKFKEMRNLDPLATMKAGLKIINDQATIEDKYAAGRSIGLESTRETNTALLLIRVLDLFDEHSKKAASFYKDGAEHERQFGVQAEGTYAKLQMLGNAFVRFSGALEGTTLNVIKPMADATKGLLDLASGAMEKPKDAAGQVAAAAANEVNREAFLDIFRRAAGNPMAMPGGRERLQKVFEEGFAHQTREHFKRQAEELAAAPEAQREQVRRRHAEENERKRLRGLLPKLPVESDEEKAKRRQAAEQEKAAAAKTQAEEVIRGVEGEIKLRKENIATIEREAEAINNSVAKGLDRVRRAREVGREDQAANLMGGIEAAQRYQASLNRKLVTEDDAIKAALARKAEAEKQIAEANAKLPKDEEAEKKKAEAAKTRRAQLENAARNWGQEFHKDPRGTEALLHELTLGRSRLEFVGSEVKAKLVEEMKAGKNLDWKQVVAGAGRDDILAFARQEAAVKQAFAGQIAADKAQRLYARPTFQGAEESWKRIAAGAAEGDPITKELRQNAKLIAETNKALAAVQAAIEAGNAAVKDGMIIMTGEP